jgi:hypothetical protein
MFHLRDKFKKSIFSLPPMPQEADVTRNAFIIHDHIKVYLGENGYATAGAALELLMSKKVSEAPHTGDIQIRMRRDGKTPDFLHELRIGMSLIADHAVGMLPGRSMDRLLALAFIHDMGEDFNVLPDGLVAFLERNSRDSNGKSGLKSNLSDAAEIAAQGMERLTFDRRYTAAQIRHEIGLKECDAPLRRCDLENMCDKLESGSKASAGAELPPLRFLDEPDAKGRYVYSRFIRDGILDWIEYGRSFSADPHTGLVKMKDRNDGLGTRIGAVFDIESYSQFLSKSFHIFATEKTGEKLAERSREFHDSLMTTDNMLGALHRIGRTYVEAHPLKNLRGTKGFLIENLSDSMDFRTYFPGAYRGYSEMPEGAMPLNIILERIRHEPTLNGKGEVLYGRFVESIHKNIARNDPSWFDRKDQLSFDF